jgi:hypothetical protein
VTAAIQSGLLAVEAGKRGADSEAAQALQRYLGITASYDSEMTIENLVSEACKRLPRNLTRAEWAFYIRDELYPIKQEDATCPNLPIEPEPTATVAP